MKRKIYIGVDVSKNWLDLAYYDGVEIDWKSGHIRVDNNKSGYRRISLWILKSADNFQRSNFAAI